MELDELPVLRVIEPQKVARGTDARIHDEFGHQVGAASGTAFGRGRGIEIADLSGRVVVRLRRHGLSGRELQIADGAGNELGQLVPMTRRLSRADWELRARGSTVALLPRAKAAGVHVTVQLPDGTVLASIDGKASTAIAIFDTEGHYVLRRFHRPDPWWGLLELGALFGIDAALRAADAAHR